ncbi:MAG: proteasome subunit beta [Candidatus Entotheonella factor]|uniref:Proteasome subunit beta n=1 Tax=Entotheonella factor TaxID=1429438 RepID=W4LZF4_ENTF1|nr:MAG: proteasome subunit beta [Candidatus Entotheonella factor]
MLIQGSYDGSSFFDLLQHDHVHLLPLQHLPQLSPGTVDLAAVVPFGTTVLALRFADGIVIGGDRQATEGFEVSSRRIEKVYNADDYSVIAIAGAAGPCLEMVKLFQIEMEHYQKIEGEVLVLEGKANKLAQMIRQNLPAAFQGLIVIPIFAGYDLNTQEGRIYKYDVTGGRYEERDFYSTGSGSREARSTLKKRFEPNLRRDAAVRLALEALVDAADLDVGTSGPDLYRGIYPVIKIITKNGIEDVSEDELRPVSEALLASLKG